MPFKNKIQRIQLSWESFLKYKARIHNIAGIKTFKTFEVFNLKAGLIASHYYLAGVTEKQKQRDRRRFEHASEKEAGLLSRDGLISMFHPEENSNMFGIIVEVRFCCVLCSL